MESKNKFIILTQPRTGSTLMYLALGSHSQIPCHLTSRGEEFSPIILSKEKSNVNKKMNKIFKHNKPDGAKIFYHHLKNEEWKWVKNNNIKIINLIRKNSIRRYVSYEIAKLKNTRFIALKDSNYKNPKLKHRQIIVNFDDLINDLKNTKQKINWAEKFFKNTAYMKVYYEDMIANFNSEMKRVLKFLNLSDEELEIKTIHQDPEKLKELIINYDEICKKMKKLNNQIYMEWLND